LYGVNIQFSDNYKLFKILTEMNFKLYLIHIQIIIILNTSTMIVVNRPLLIIDQYVSILLTSNNFGQGFLKRFSIFADTQKTACVVNNLLITIGVLFIFNLVK